MKSIIIVVLILIIFNINFNNSLSYPVVQSQNSTAIDIYKNIFLVDVSNLANFEICYTSYIKCTESIAEPGLYEIFEITFWNPTNAIIVPIEVTQDLSVFKSLAHIRSTVGVFIFGEIFYGSMGGLLKLIDFDIASQPLEIPIYTTLPLSLKSINYGMISVPLPTNFFESDSLKSISIRASSNGFKLPTDLSWENNNLDTLIVPISSYSTIYSDMGNYLTNITKLELSVYNNDELEFPDLSSFKSLDSLTVTFNNDQSDYNSLVYPQSIVNLPITSLTFNGLGFIIDNNLDKFDLSNGIQPIDFKVNYGGPSTSSILLPKGSQFSIDYTDFNLSLVDYSNIIYFVVKNNQLEQSLPIINSPLSFDYFEISSSNVHGSIPQNYCQLKNPYIGENQLDGSIPTCFTCLGGFQSRILPNNFSNFNSSSVPVCPDFKVIVDDFFIIPTNGGNITVTGINLGWFLGIQSELIYGEINYEVIPNEMFIITIPSGTGYGCNLTIEFDNGFKKVIKLNYTVPLINYYTIKHNDNNNTIFEIHGKGFDYNNNNNFIDNSNNGYSIDFGIPNINDTLSYNDIEWIIGSKHELFINVGIEISGIQTSNIITFYYYPNIQILNNEQINIFDIIGTILINGSFVDITDLSLVTVSINNYNCIVNSISSTFINITYPSISTIGNNDMSINIGGNNLFTTVNIIKSPTQPPTPTPTTNNSDDDQPSVSSNLSISTFNIILFLISSLLLLLLLFK